MESSDLSREELETAIDAIDGAVGRGTINPSMIGGLPSGHSTLPTYLGLGERQEILSQVRETSALLRGSSIGEDSEDLDFNPSSSGGDLYDLLQQHPDIEWSHAVDAQESYNERTAYEGREMGPAELPMEALLKPSRPVARPVYDPQPASQRGHSSGPSFMDSGVECPQEEPDGKCKITLGAGNVPLDRPLRVRSGKVPGPLPIPHDEAGVFYGATPRGPLYTVCASMFGPNWGSHAYGLCLDYRSAVKKGIRGPPDLPAFIESKHGNMTQEEWRQEEGKLWDAFEEDRDAWRTFKSMADGPVVATLLNQAVEILTDRESRTFAEVSKLSSEVTTLRAQVTEMSAQLRTITTHIAALASDTARISSRATALQITTHRPGRAGGGGGDYELPSESWRMQSLASRIPQGGRNRPPATQLSESTKLLSNLKTGLLFAVERHEGAGINKMAIASAIRGATDKSSLDEVMAELGLKESDLAL